MLLFWKENHCESGALFKVLPMAISVFSENLCFYTFHTLWGCEILPKHSPWRSFMKFIHRSRVTSSNQRFFKFKILKKLTRKRSRRIGKWLVWQFCLTLWMKWGRCTVGFFSIQIHWEVMSNLSFLGSLRNSKLLITSQWIWIETNPTVHLHYFIHRVLKTKLPDQSFSNPIATWTFSCQFFQNFEFEKPLSWWCHMTSVNEFHERSPRGMFGQNFTSLQGLEGV